MHTLSVSKRRELQKLKCTKTVLPLLMEININNHKQHMEEFFLFKTNCLIETQIKATQYQKSSVSIPSRAETVIIPIMHLPISSSSAFNVTHIYTQQTQHKQYTRNKASNFKHQNPIISITTPKMIDSPSIPFYLSQLTF